jgi:hypothetical protein
VLRQPVVSSRTTWWCPPGTGRSSPGRGAGAASALEILELANSQLLQYRYYDDLLDAELAGTYAKLQTPRWYDALAGRRFTRAARHLHQVYIEVNELTDRTENALKVVGDMYAARLFARVGARVGLDGWKASVEDKLRTLDGIYRFAVEQTGMRRGQFLEATIVLILILELALCCWDHGVNAGFYLFEKLSSCVRVSGPWRGHGRRVRRRRLDGRADIQRHRPRL